MNCFVLAHPQSPMLVSSEDFAGVHHTVISCGTTKTTADYSEANDFFPTYASWNSSLFETSVILTIWEHSEQLVGQGSVAIMHSDIEAHFSPSEIWQRVQAAIAERPKRAVGLVAPSQYTAFWSDWEIPEEANFRPKHDPMSRHAFDAGVFVWDYIKKYDADIYDWAVTTQPLMLYSHQFACSADVFEALGCYLKRIASRLTLGDVGFWTPHMFERLIALFLAKHGGDPLLTTAFWHHSASGSYGPGEQTLYGPRPRRWYKTRFKPANK